MVSVVLSPFVRELVGCFPADSSLFHPSDRQEPPALETLLLLMVVIYKALKPKILDCTELESGRRGGLQGKEAPLWNPILTLLFGIPS